MQIGLTLTAVLIALTVPAAAQEGVPEDVMEVQRCIWSCMRESGGADNPAYPRCVSRMCNDEPPAAKQVKRKNAKAAKRQSSRRIQRNEPVSRDIIVRKIQPRIIYVD